MQQRRLRIETSTFTLIDRKNHHTFQPLLYQVATTVLSPNQIAVPLRSILRKAKNIEVLLGEVVEIDIEKQSVRLANQESVAYDFWWWQRERGTRILATTSGSRTLPDSRRSKMRPKFISESCRPLRKPSARPS